jgi:hypothetical protein
MGVDPVDCSRPGSQHRVRGTVSIFLGVYHPPPYYLSDIQVRHAKFHFLDTLSCSH